jgi:hypothetical protein
MYGNGEEEIALIFTLMIDFLMQISILVVLKTSSIKLNSMMGKVFRGKLIKISFVFMLNTFFRRLKNTLFGDKYYLRSDGCFSLGIVHKLCKQSSKYLLNCGVF